MANTNEQKTVYVGPSLLGITTLVFVVLKLTGVINWSWWWVLGPLWIPSVIVLVLVMLGAAIAGIIDWRKKRKKKGFQRK